MWKGVVSAVLFAVALRVFVGLGGHSGRNSPPMYGDFEAQRHWMELTTALPSNAWYSFVTFIECQLTLQTGIPTILRTGAWTIRLSPLSTAMSLVLWAST
jgi:hypothetical protein